MEKPFLLIGNNGLDYEQREVEIHRFDTLKQMQDFINKQNVLFQAEMAFEIEAEFDIKKPLK